MMMIGWSLPRRKSEPPTTRSVFYQGIAADLGAALALGDDVERDHETLAVLEAVVIVIFGLLCLLALDTSPVIESLWRAQACRRNSIYCASLLLELMAKVAASAPCVPVAAYRYATALRCSAIVPSDMRLAK